MPLTTEAKSSILPYSRVYIDDTEEPVREGAVEFRLLYEGELFASANGSAHVKHKHAIRRVFHAQLRRQWEMHPGLRHHVINSQPPSHIGATEQERFETGISAIGRNWTRVGYDFVPLVTTDFPVRCSIDILLLRPGEAQHVARQGDIDGQVKTIFDALRMPDNENETAGIGPQEDEHPFFCLLADDKLISRLRLVADELLLLPREKQVKGTDAFAVITVNIEAKLIGGMGNYW